jgi:choline dehydrogenase-like flavoprotein
VQTGTGTAVHLARGRGLGGSSTLNAMMFARGHRDSYADWNRFGAKEWTFDDLLPYFKRSETAAHGDSAVRGNGGPLLVARASPTDEVLTATLCAAVQTGYPRAKDVSSGFETGFAPPDLTIVDGIGSLRVHGINGLRIVDASMMPSLPSNNTLATVYAIAERGAELIRRGLYLRRNCGEIAILPDFVFSPQFRSTR